LCTRLIHYLLVVIFFVAFVINALLMIVFAKMMVNISFKSMNLLWCRNNHLDLAEWQDHLLNIWSSLGSYPSTGHEDSL